MAITITHDVVVVDAVIAASTEIFATEVGVIKHIFWNGATNAHILSLVDKDGNRVFKHIASTGNLSPFFLNINRRFNGLYIDDLDGGELILQLETLVPQAKELKI